jgi:hypothetical protein
VAKSRTGLGLWMRWLAPRSAPSRERLLLIYCTFGRLFDSFFFAGQRRRLPYGVAHPCYYNCWLQIWQWPTPTWQTKYTIPYHICLTRPRERESAHICGTGVAFIPQMAVDDPALFSLHNIHLGKSNCQNAPVTLQRGQ